MQSTFAHSQIHSPTGTTRLKASFSSLTRSLAPRNKAWFFAARAARSRAICETDMSDPQCGAKERQAGVRLSKSAVRRRSLENRRAPKGPRLGLRSLYSRESHAGLCHKRNDPAAGGAVETGGRMLASFRRVTPAAR